MLPMEKNNLDSLEKVINYKFKNHHLLIEALSHPSLNHNIHDKFAPRVSNYERLEFLGDTVLNLVISDLIYHLHPDYDEGMLAKLRSSLVCKEQISDLAKSINLAKYIIMTEGEEKGGGRLNENNLENAMEAILGAVYLDSNFEQAKAVINNLWQKVLKSPIELYPDPKSAVQEWVQARHMPIPDYEVIEQSGSPHSPIFKVRIQVGGFIATGSGKAKKAAEKEAARNLLKLLSNSKRDES
ncbi:MAG: rnc [Rickettsiaceae bacterium]|jgi:ribonuclease III|nr:rnc [Rickettsiaceae bacterium]